MISSCLKNSRGRFSSTFGPDVPPHTHQPAARREGPHRLVPRGRARRSRPRRRPSRGQRSAAESSAGRPRARGPARRLAASRDVAYDRGAHAPGQGQRGGDDAAADADDEHRLAGREPGPAQHPPRREGGQAGRRRTPPSVRPAGRATTLRGRHDDAARRGRPSAARRGSANAGHSGESIAAGHDRRRPATPPG